MLRVGRRWLILVKVGLTSGSLVRLVLANSFVCRLLRRLRRPQVMLLVMVVIRVLVSVQADRCRL